MGEFDVLKERISAFKYKEILTSKIKEIINEGKIPLIEGGSGFYLNYFMSSGDAKIEYSELIKAGKTAREIIEKKFNKDWKQWFFSLL